MVTIGALAFPFELSKLSIKPISTSESETLFTVCPNSITTSSAVSPSTF